MKFRDVCAAGGALGEKGGETVGEIIYERLK